MHQGSADDGGLTPASRPASAQPAGPSADDPAFYRFRNTWTACGDAATAFLVLRDLPTYPDWWREVRSVRVIDETAAVVSMRSVLPYTLEVEILERRADARNGILEAELRGDLAGFSRWTIRGCDGRLRLSFVEEVRLEVPALVRLGRPVRPVLRWNHARMMANGERGLRIFLAGAGFRPTPPPRQ